MVVSARGAAPDDWYAPELLAKGDGDAVHVTWSRRAHELCGGDYVELASQELDETLKPINSEVLRDHVTSRIAFALCASSKLSEQEALDVINGLGLLPAPTRTTTK